MSIRCRECGGNHLTITCPKRSPEKRAKSWKQQKEKFEAEEDAKPFKCFVRMHTSKTLRVCEDDLRTFWESIQTAVDHSLFRDYVGIEKKNSDHGVLYPIGHDLLEPGEYSVVSRTYALSDEELQYAIAEGVAILKQQRPLSSDIVERVQGDLLLSFNHFSLSHEGNNLELDETRMLTDLLVGKDWERMIEDEEVESEFRKIPGSETDIKEAINHIFLSPSSFPNCTIIL